MNVAGALIERAAKSPERFALIEGSSVATSLTYGDLVAKSSSVTNLLIHEGIKRGDRILIFHPPTLDLYVTLVAIFRIGAVAMVVEPTGGATLLTAACAAASPAALLASPRTQLGCFLWKSLREIPIKLTTGWTLLPAININVRERTHPSASVIADLAPDDPALITFTSGSTGVPKAAVRTHAMLDAQRDALADVTGRDGDVELCTLPIVTLANLANGVTTVLPDADLRRPARADGARLIAQIEAHNCSRLTASPAILERIVAEHKRASVQLKGLRAIVTGGGPVFPRLIADVRLAAPNARVIAVYGSTEAEPIAHVSDDEIGSTELEMMRAGAGLLAGKIADAADVRILADRWGEPIPELSPHQLDEMTLPAGEVGEIAVAGDHVVRGYLNGVGDTEAKIRVAGRTWHRTGDLGRLDERGRLWLLGRAAGAVPDGRGAMYPFAVECAVRERFGVSNVAAIAVDGRRTIVLGGAAAGVADSEITDAIPWANIDRVVRIDAIPMDRRHNSKVDYTELRRRIAASR